MRTTLVLVATVAWVACGPSTPERPATWTELEGWPDFEAESFRVEGVVSAVEGAEGWVVEDGEGGRWIPMSLPETFRLPTLAIQADVRLRPDLLSLGMPGELVEVLRIRAAPGSAVVEGPNSERLGAAPDGPTTPEHPVWGEWRIVGHVAPGVSAMSEARASSWTGRAIEFDASSARSPNGECLDPTYHDRNETVDALLSGEYGVPASSMPLLADLERIDVVEVRCGGSGWGAAGEVVLLLDQRRAFTPWDGVFFELRRTG